MRNILIISLILFIAIFIRVCFRYELKNYYYGYSDTKNLLSEKLENIFISNDEIMFISSEKISKDLVLEKISISANNLELGETIINQKIFEKLDAKDYSENKNIYQYFISDDIIKILGKNYEKMKSNENEELQGKEFNISIFLKNVRTNKSYKIEFKNTSLFYQEKGFDIWIPD